MDGQDAAIVGFLERFGDEPPVTASDRTSPERAPHSGHIVGTTLAATSQAGAAEDEKMPSEQDVRGGGDGTRTHDPLLAKQDHGSRLSSDDVPRALLTSTFDYRLLPATLVTCERLAA